VASSSAYLLLLLPLTPMTELRNATQPVQAAASTSADVKSQSDCFVSVSS